MRFICRVKKKYVCITTHINAHENTETVYTRGRERGVRNAIIGTLMDYAIIFSAASMFHFFF